MTKRGIVVVGSLHYDIVVDAPHLPERDETVIGGGVSFVCGGKGGNQAVAASLHGGNVSMAGRVGDDPFAAELLRNLQAAGVDTVQIQRSTDANSGMSVAIVDANGDYGAVVVSAVNREIEAGGIVIPGDTALLVLQNEIPEAVNRHAARLARDSGATVILNAAPMREMDAELVALVDVMVVNRVEAGALFASRLRDVEHVLACAGARQSGPRHLIVTLGGEGLVHHRSGEMARYFPAPRVDVVSSHGAGDVFVGALAARYAAGCAIEDAIAYAGSAAALYVSTPVRDRHALSPDAVEAFLSRSA